MADTAPDIKKDLITVGIAALIVIVISGLGAWAGAALIGAADKNSSCAPRTAQGSWNGLQVSGLPDSLQLPFGYARGTRAVQNVITVTAPTGVTLPASIPVFVEPLVTSDGSQTIPLTAPTSPSATPTARGGASATGTATPSASASASATPTPDSSVSGTGTAKVSASPSSSAGAGAAPTSGRAASATGAANSGTTEGTPETNQLVSATATRIASSSIYQIELCITPSNVAAGSYSGQLLFPGATLASGTSLPVTVTFQSRVVPFALTVGGLPLALCGMLYTTIILIRRSTPTPGMGNVIGALRQELWSLNGLVALLLSVGAVFTAWYAQCFRDPTWGSPWPAILITFGTMTAAAAGASTVPIVLPKSSS
jgi:hypothetical protein